MILMIPILLYIQINLGNEQLCWNKQTLVNPKHTTLFFVEHSFNVHLIQLSRNLGNIWGPC